MVYYKCYYLYRNNYNNTTMGAPYRDRSHDKEDMAEFLEVLKQNNGNLYQTYTNLPNWNYSKFYELRRNNPEFAKAIEDIKESTVRWVESLMFDKIAKGDKDLMKFYLKMQGQKQGYQEVKKVEAEVKQAIDIEKQLEEMAANLEDDPFAE